MKTVANYNRNLRRCSQQGKSESNSLAHSGDSRRLEVRMQMRAGIACMQMIVCRPRSQSGGGRPRWSTDCSLKQLAGV